MVTLFSTVMGKRIYSAVFSFTNRIRLSLLCLWLILSASLFILAIILVTMDFSYSARNRDSVSLTRFFSTIESFSLSGVVRCVCKIIVTQQSDVIFFIFFKVVFIKSDFSLS